MRQDLDYVFDSLLSDILVLHKTDGRVFENIRARVSTRAILITDVHVPIEVGDKLIRTQFNGLKDEFIVDDPGYQAVLPAHGVPAHFQVKVHRSVSKRLAHSPVAPPGVQEAQPGAERNEAPTAERRRPKELVDTCRRRLKIRSYEKFAAKVGISKDTLYAITKESRWVSDQVYELVAEFCGCKHEDLHPSGLLRRKSDRA